MNVIAPHRWQEFADLPSKQTTGENDAKTIGDLLTSGRGLTATCEVCLHSSRLDLSDLASRLGAFHSCSQTALRPKLQCSVCKSTEAVLQGSRPRRHPVTRAVPAPRIPAYV
jgi:hypothetical protein